MSNDKVKILITVDTGFSGASHEDEIEVDRAEWEAMTKDEQDDFMAPEIDAVIADHIVGSYKVVED